MAEYLSRLEELPNEILVEIFKYFDAQDLFRAFNNVNSHFNAVIRSLDYLVFTSSNDDATEINDFSTYIDALIINCEININLNRFQNVRYLSIHQLTDELSEQLNADIIPFLEHIVITRSSYTMFDVCEKIFINGFPHLKSCYLPNGYEIRIIQHHIQIPSLRILHIDYW